MRRALRRFALSSRWLGSGEYCRHRNTDRAAVNMREERITVMFANTKGTGLATVIAMTLAFTGCGDEDSKTSDSGDRAMRVAV